MQLELANHGAGSGVDVCQQFSGAQSHQSPTAHQELALDGGGALAFCGNLGSDPSKLQAEQSHLESDAATEP